MFAWDDSARVVSFLCFNAKFERSYYLAVHPFISKQERSATYAVPIRPLAMTTGLTSTPRIFTYYDSCAHVHGVQLRISSYVDKRFLRGFVPACYLVYRLYIPISFALTVIAHI